MPLLLVALIAGIVVLTPLADRLRVPQPVLLLIYGLALALLPGLPALQLDATLVLPVVLPPLLFAATQRTTVQQFRDAVVPISLLAVGLTVATAAVVAVVAHLVGMPWAPAAVLGAIVSPPDPVAATAVARRLRLPERVVTILEGEGMFNDATALVLYKVTLGVALTDEFSPLSAARDLLLAVIVGVGLGWLLALGVKLALMALHQGAAEATLTLAVPFVAYQGAEHFGGSGVLAVLVLGLYLRHSGHSAISARGWVVGRTVWEYLDFLIASLVFVLLGFELTSVIGHTPSEPASLLLAGTVFATIVVFRPLWMFPAVLVARALDRRHQGSIPSHWRETTVVSWAGMRGVVTVATAIALPALSDQADARWRNQVVLTALTCVLMTLILQGLTLRPLIRLLGVGTEAHGREEVRRLGQHAVEAALERLRSQPHDDAAQAVLETYRARLQAQQALTRFLDATIAGSSGDDRGAQAEQRLREAFALASAAERDFLLGALNSGEATPTAADEVLMDVEIRATQTGNP